MKKRTITLTFDCYIGPIVGVAVDESGREITKIAIIDDDTETQKIVDEARTLSKPMPSPAERGVLKTLRVFRPFTGGFKICHRGFQLFVQGVSGKPAGVLHC